MKFFIKKFLEVFVIFFEIFAKKLNDSFLDLHHMLTSLAAGKKRFLLVDGVDDRQRTVGNHFLSALLLQKLCKRVWRNGLRPG